MKMKMQMQMQMQMLTCCNRERCDALAVVPMSPRRAVARARTMGPATTPALAPPLSLSLSPTKSTEEEREEEEEEEEGGGTRVSLTIFRSALASVGGSIVTTRLREESMAAPRSVSASGVTELPPGRIALRLVWFSFEIVFKSLS